MIHRPISTKVQGSFCSSHKALNHPGHDSMDSGPPAAEQVASGLLFLELHMLWLGSCQSAAEVTTMWQTILGVPPTSEDPSQTFTNDTMAVLFRRLGVKEIGVKEKNVHIEPQVLAT